MLISDEEQQLNICKTFSLTDNEAKLDDLQVLHYLKEREGKVKFKCRKQKHKVLIDRKNLRGKSEDLRQLTFPGKFFLSKSICIP